MCLDPSQEFLEDFQQLVSKFLDTVGRKGLALVSQCYGPLPNQNCSAYSPEHISQAAYPTEFRGILFQANRLRIRWLDYLVVNRMTCTPG